ncbi:MAG: hypothetical protein A2605_02565 [Candidatus Zambryskibacteria bacterium RIFOXYD1_FULL_39_35]|nr:MAG: hypothetical protein A2605_02565 [Candidatus Zambryskibacteria bacterium RIFOXYD1_FULL_39_35]
MISKLLGLAGALFLLMVVLALSPPTTEVRPLFPEKWIGIGLIIAIAACLVAAALIGIAKGISWFVWRRRGRKAIDRFMEANHPLPDLMARWRL